MRRGERAIELCERSVEAAGIVGEDILIENGASGDPIEPIERNGQQLRFALLAGRGGLTLAQLQDRENVSIVTSYPRIAKLLLDEIGINAALTTVKGCVEAELQPEGEFMAAIELVQSGASVIENDLTVVADDLLRLRLMKIGKGDLL